MSSIREVTEICRDLGYYPGPVEFARKNNYLMNKFAFPAHVVKLFIVAILILAGIFFLRSELFDTDKLLALAREYTGHWWLVPVLILAQIILYTFALSGSYALWITAPLYSPVIATTILATGGTLGAICAYYFSRNLTDKWVARVERSKSYKLLQHHNNFLSLFALRTLPGFPHGLINYSSGILDTRLAHFLPATILGFAIKFYIYSTVIHNATEVISKEETLDSSALGPLVLLSLLAFTGVFIRHRLENKSAS